MTVKQAVFVVAMAISVCASAQAIATVRVTRASAVLQQPAGGADAVGMVAEAEILEVLDTRDGWFLVRPAGGQTTAAWRTGWVNGATVQPVGTPEPNPLGQGGRSAATRKGFVFGLGGGGGLAREPGFSVADRFGRVTTVGGSNRRAIATDLRIGWAPSDQLMIFYNNQANFLGDSTRFDAVGLTGVGVTYFRQRTAPSTFFTGSIGAAAGATLDGRTADLGVGLSAGAGIEFRRHWTVSGQASWLEINGGRYGVYRGLFSYIYY